MNALPRFRLWRAIIGGAWGCFKGGWYRADTFGWLVGRPDAHLLCCDSTESYEAPLHRLASRAAVVALRALVSPAYARAILGSNQGGRARP